MYGCDVWEWSVTEGKRRPCGFGWVGVANPTCVKLFDFKQQKKILTNQKHINRNAITSGWFKRKRSKNKSPSHIGIGWVWGRCRECCGMKMAGGLLDGGFAGKPQASRPQPEATGRECEKKTFVGKD